MLTEWQKWSGAGVSMVKRLSDSGAKGQGFLLQDLSVDFKTEV